MVAFPGYQPGKDKIFLIKYEIIKIKILEI